MSYQKFNLNIPCDGVVWKYEDLTFDTTRTDKFFNNAVAWKPANETYDTKLLDIEYTIGRTGKLTPVAVFEPVDILGSECERASLHNLSIMEQIFGTLCPDKGTPIKVFKADLIIPQVETAEKSGNGLPIPILENCPICGEKLIIKLDDFEIINKNNEFKNPRNTAAGTLNLLDMSIVKQRRLSFIAWDVIEGGDYKTYSDNIVEARQLGFEPVFWTFETDNDYILLW